MAAYQDNEEKQLIRAAAGGDERALRALYEAHAGRAYALALRLTRSESDAEEVVQEAFIRAFRALSAFRAQSRFSTWLYRIVVNRCNDLLASRQRRLRRQDNLARELEEASEPEVKSDPLAERRLQAALEQLPAGYREVLLLHDMLGFDHGHIARTLGIGRGTSKSQLHKARARMRQLLEQ